MSGNLNVRLGVVFTVLALAIIWCVPNFMTADKTKWLVKDRMVLGLDIQGGSHLVLRVDVDSVLRQDTKRMSNTILNEMKTANIAVSEVKVLDPLIGHMELSYTGEDTQAKVQEQLTKMYSQVLHVVGTSPGKTEVRYAELYVRDFKQRLLDQAIATIRNRIDEFGVAEPSITAQGSDRILVQLPGIKDASSAKDLINRTARLDFMMVDDAIPQDQLLKLIADAELAHGLKFQDMKYSEYVTKINEALKDKIPAERVVYFEKAESAVSMEAGRMPYLLKLDETVAGDKLTTATVGMSQYGQPEVHFAFDPVGARSFGEMTTKNVGHRMAIVLDRVVKSAPNIRSAITGGQGMIEMGGGRDADQTLKEAKLISMALRAGALPATLEQLEERTVGPSLGADAIKKGEVAALAAAALVFVFMAFYYKSFGIIANLSLVFNIMLVIAILSALGATLTLPGIAGLALNIGIAVDANVIIFERIKEEMKKGANIGSAIRDGYSHAFSSIFDANVTSTAVCIVLMYFGTGPVRGFAVTLLCGLVTQLFTAVFFTRALLDLTVGRWKWKLAIR